MSTITKSSKIGNRVRICRMLSRISQEDLAFLLGVPITHISKWENWSVNPSVYYAVGLSVAFHRLVDEIFPNYRNEWVKTINQRAQILEKRRSKIIANDNDKR